MGGEGAEPLGRRRGGGFQRILTRSPSKARARLVLLVLARRTGRAAPHALVWPAARVFPPGATGDAVPRHRHPRREVARLAEGAHTRAWRACSGMEGVRADGGRRACRRRRRACLRCMSTVWGVHADGAGPRAWVLYFSLSSTSPPSISLSLSPSLHLSLSLSPSLSLSLHLSRSRSFRPSLPLSLASSLSIPPPPPSLLSRWKEGRMHASMTPRLLPPRLMA